jgi:hypothetical protein
MPYITYITLNILRLSNGIQEVRGSIPLISTKLETAEAVSFGGFCMFERRDNHGGKSALYVCFMNWVQVKNIVDIKTLLT